ETRGAEGGTARFPEGHDGDAAHAAQVDGLDALPVHRDLHLATALRGRDLVEPGQPMDRSPLVRPRVPELRLPLPFLGPPLLPPRDPLRPDRHPSPEVRPLPTAPRGDGGLTPNRADRDRVRGRG